MTLENQVKSVLEQKMTDGTVEKLVGEYVEKGIASALKDLFSSYGDVTKVIEKKLKDVMVPQIERHDFSQYLVKLDAVLTELANVTSLENKKILNNFSTLMTETPRKIKASELFEKWMKFAGDEVETDGLEVEFDGEPSYESVEVTLTFEQLDRPSWSSFENGQLLFECEHDEKLNFVIPLHRWESRDDYWRITDLESVDLSSLRDVNSFEVFIRSLKQNYTEIHIDTDCEREYVTPTATPEAEWS